MAAHEFFNGLPFGESGPEEDLHFPQDAVAVTI
jgi:hypothetical protein